MRTIPFLLLICALGAPVLAQQEASGGTDATIRALEQQWTAAQSRNDNRSLDLIFDNALVYVEYGKLISKGEYLSRIKSQPSGLDQIVMEPITVRLFGSTAIAVGSYVEKQNQGGRHNVKRWRFIDTWVHKKSGWVLVAAAAAPAPN